MKKTYLLLALMLPSLSFGQKPDDSSTESRLNHIAESYVRLALAIGQYDGDFVDAYYGPDSLKPTTVKQSSFPKDIFLKRTSNLQEQLTVFINDGKDPLLTQRAKWMSSQLTAFSRRIRMFAGESASFELQAKELFGVTPPVLNEAYFASQIKQLDSLLPGEGANGSNDFVVSIHWF
jgi:hypothetical protein